MNQPVLLHIVERLETFLGRLPETIQRPILNELTPLKELFLQQRPPRFLFRGSSKTSMPQIIRALFSPGAKEQMSVTAMPVHRWADWNIEGHGIIAILDAREADDSAQPQIQEELRRQPADVIFLVDDGEKGRAPYKEDLEKMLASIKLNETARDQARVVAISSGTENRVAQLEKELNTQPLVRGRLLAVLHLSETEFAEVRRLMRILAEGLPNEAKIEMIRISRDLEAQRHVAQLLVKSTTAICTAIGAQPIPLADLPILTTLQLVMVSGIMYVSGRERSLRAATEFVGALGANVGAGLIFREGARAILKFFPGWGNVVCGMVAGAGTYAIGRAATVFFLEGVSLKEARRTYLASRKKSGRPNLLVTKETEEPAPKPRGKTLVSRRRRLGRSSTPE
jgi:uncharacterized protein (DUF697 family)